MFLYLKWHLPLSVCLHLNTSARPYVSVFQLVSQLFIADRPLNFPGKPVEEKQSNDEILNKVLCPAM